MMTPSNGNFSALHALCVGNLAVIGDFPLTKARCGEKSIMKLEYIWQE